MPYNVENLWESYHIWIKVDKDIKKWDWINLTVPKHHIKDRSLDDDILKRI